MLQHIKLNPESMRLAQDRLTAFNKSNGILRGNLERMRSRFLGVAVELDFVKRMNGEYPDTYADVNVPDDNGLDIVLDGVMYDVKVTRPPNAASWVWSKNQLLRRKQQIGTEYSYLFLSANPKYTEGSMLPYECIYVAVGQLTADEVAEKATAIRQKKDEKNITVRVTNRDLNSIKINL
jgi:hypothetical protein